MDEGNSLGKQLAWQAGRAIPGGPTGSHWEFLHPRAGQVKRQQSQGGQINPAVKAGRCFSGSHSMSHGPPAIVSSFSPSASLATGHAGGLP